MKEPGRLVSANPFWASDTYAVIRAMKATGNRAGVVAQWKDFVEQWAIAHSGDPDAKAMLASLPSWQVRPFYTAAELAPMFPAIIVSLGFAQRTPHRKSPARLSYELQYGGLPLLENVNGTTKFKPLHGGDAQSYFIVERIHHWRSKPITQEEFENAILG